MSNLQQFTDFLKTINLKGYREKYNPIKIVEMDLPKNIQAIALLYEVYWDKKEFIIFEDFYKIYLDKLKDEIEEFRIKTTMCKNCFYRGLPARIYRTWASLITQIHGGYVAEAVFGNGSVDMSAELDHSGADFQVKYKNKILNYQVKKKSESREVRQEKKTKKKIKGKFITIKYEVPNFDHIINSKTKKGKLRADYRRFYNKYLKTKKLAVLNNGFVIFKEATFLSNKKRLDSKA